MNRPSSTSSFYRTFSLLNLVFVRPSRSHLSSLSPSIERPYLSVSLAVVADDLVGGEVAEDLVGRGVGPDPVLVVDYLPVAEPNFLPLRLFAAAAAAVLLLQSKSKLGLLKQCFLSLL